MKTGVLGCESGKPTNTAAKLIMLYSNGKKNSVLRIRYVYSGSRIRIFPIPDQIFFHPGSRIRIKEFKYLQYFNPKKWFLSSRKYDLGCSSSIRILTFYTTRIPDPGVNKAPDPGPGTATLQNYKITHLFSGSSHRPLTSSVAAPAVCPPARTA